MGWPPGPRRFRKIRKMSEVEEPASVEIREREPAAGSDTDGFVVAVVARLDAGLILNRWVSTAPVSHLCQSH